MNSATTLTPEYTTPIRGLNSNNSSAQRIISPISLTKPFIIDVEYVQVLISRENIYYPSMINFNLNNHTNIKWHHRCILLDWTMEVC